MMTTSYQSSDVIILQNVAAEEVVVGEEDRRGAAVVVAEVDSTAPGKIRSIHHKMNMTENRKDRSYQLIKKTRSGEFNDRVRTVRNQMMKSDKHEDHRRIGQHHNDQTGDVSKTMASSGGLLVEISSLIMGVGPLVKAFGDPDPVIGPSSLENKMHVPTVIDAVMQHWLPRSN
eukprot:gb/GECG01009188.1/.p1 GENE.gb/GECG01009188.1/~~gb/GECG01009188.1/.p1  ORF type:complete len:173 (+),score=13.32 gb/GECG01009188.1/:1-519(+)